MIKKKKILLIIGAVIFILCAFTGCGSSEDENSSQNNVVKNNNTTTSKYSYNNTSNTTKVEKKDVVIADFSTMTEEEAENWGTTNKITVYVKDEYSDTVEKGSFISQSVVANGSIKEGSSVTVKYSLGKAPTTGQKDIKTTEINVPSNLEIMTYSQTVLDDYVDNPSYSRNENDYNIIKTNLRYKIEGKVNNENFWLIIEFTDNTYKDYDVISLQVGNEKLVK